MASREEVNAVRGEVYELERLVNKLYNSGAGEVTVSHDFYRQMQPQTQRVTDRISNLFGTEVVR